MSDAVFFFDFDGPILDVSEKFYRTYYDLLTKESQPALDKFTYWELKRNQTKEEEIHAITNAMVSDFGVKRKEIIETDYYQNMDLLQPLVVPVLQKAKQKGAVILVTLRHSHEHVLKQLNGFGILTFFDCVLSSGEHISPNWKIKYNLINEHFCGTVPAHSVFIGDTETDILTGKRIGSKTIAVLNGMRNYDRIKQLNADHIVPSIGDTLSLNLI